MGNVEITPDLLLAHAGFVRSLARQLLSDEAAVEDVVQETYIRALQSGPRKKEALPAWLRAVTRNVAFKAMRSSRRRRRREHVAARGEGLPSTSDLVEKEQSLKSVVDSVLALPEHYRQVVMLRYFEDVPPRKIAVQLDLPVNTVRMRLHRALKQLRSSLDREYGKPGAWCPGVALLAGLPRPEAGAAPATASATEAASSSIALPALQVSLVALGLVGAAVALVVWARSDTGAAPETTAIVPAQPHTALAEHESVEPKDASTNTRAPLAQPEPETSAPTPPSEPVTSETEPYPLLVASGLVVDPAGEPVGDAEVFTEWGPAGMTMRVRTDAEGRFAIDVPPEGRVSTRGPGLPVLVGARGAGLAPSTVVPWTGRAGEELVLRLRPGGVSVRGVVVDPTGAPIPGARVRVGDTYRLGSSFLGVQVMAEEAGPGRLNPAQLTDPDRAMTMQRVGHARGYLGSQALTSDGKLGRLLPTPGATTDEDGRFTVFGVEPGPTPIRVDAFGFAPDSLVLDLAAGNQRTLEFKLERAARLAGQVRREDGLPIDRGVAYVVGDAGGARRSQRIDQEGRFAFDNLPAGPVHVFADCETDKRVTHSASSELVLEAGREASWDPMLTRHDVVLGQLLDAEGEPLVGWRAQIRLHQNPSRSIAQSVTDSKGHFTFAARPPYPASLYVYQPGRAQVHPSRIVPEIWSDTERRVIRLNADEVLAGSVRGRIDLRTYTPPAKTERVLLVPAGSRHVYALRFAGTGAFESEGMPAGSYHLVMPIHGLGWVREEPIELGPGLAIDLGTVRVPKLGRLHIGGAVSGIEGLRLRIWRVCSDGFRLVVFEGRAEAPLTVSMAPGRYEIERIDGAASASVEVTVRSDEMARPNLATLR
ncbi:MAG: sigma-70 family RNA polymerase sigma factor [bacterium]|nr:sigma-70 family RNA polymerase sigma factor [bacterium]